MIWLNMYIGHHLAQFLAQAFLNLFGDLMGLSHAHVTIHLDTDVHHTQAAVAARAQVVECVHAWCAVDDGSDFVLLVAWQ